MKATAEEFRFHSRMLDPGDPTAFVALAEWIYGDLLRKTRLLAGRNADPALVEEAVGSALLEYLDDPRRYDPNKSSLLDYLRMAAYRDYLNAVDKEKRRAALSLSHDDGRERDIVDDTQAIHQLVQRIDMESLFQEIAVAFDDPTDRQIVGLLLDGERNYAFYAQALDITHLPDEEQNAQVKRVKDRVAKRLRRIGRKYHV